MEYNELEWECSLLRRNIIQEWVQYLRDPMSYSILPRPLQWVSTLSSSNHPPTWSENSSVDRSNPLNSLFNSSFSASNFNNNEDVNNSKADNSDSDYTV
ncbi:hypothetical protein Glove_186g88 [Diversispora epigaea]|uniref:Uncharacterized protein n=1 Tax=Diversispora epigaea TaxID=1348612 RepID=A0A397IM73_9GLOM|nr:hypothetical protein Glove_186g88 [Diversispora epigaea]